MIGKCDGHFFSEAYFPLVFYLLSLIKKNDASKFENLHFYIIYGG